MEDWATIKERRQRRMQARKAQKGESGLADPSAPSPPDPGAQGTDPAANPFAPVIERNLLSNDPDFWNDALTKLRQAQAQTPDGNADVATAIAWGLMKTHQLTEAEAAFRAVLDVHPDAVGADLGYFMTLRDLDRYADAVTFGRGAWTGKRNRGFCYLLSKTLLNLGNVQLADALRDEWLYLAPELGEIWELQGQIAAGLGNWDEAAEYFAYLINRGLKVPKIQAQFLRAVAKGNGEATLEENEASYAERLDRPLEEKIWVRYQLARWSRPGDVGAAFAPEPESPIRFPDIFDHESFPSNLNLNLLTEDEVNGHPGTLSGPVVSPDTLRANIAAFMDFVSELMAEGRFDGCTETLEKFRHAFTSGDRPPVFVLSTGRCGTLALLRLLERSARVIGYHTMFMYVHSIDRNHMLYRILDGRFDKDVVADLLRSYLETRMAELLYALRHDKSPVVVHHLDTVFAPFNAVFHTDSRFLYMRRDEVATYQSLLTKNQWGGQLQHWLYDRSFPDGRFVCHADGGLSIEEHIAWYLNVTQVFATAFMETMPADRVARVRSEDLFRQDPDAFAQVRKVMPIGDISEAAFKENYARKINSKTEMVDLTVDNTEEGQENVRRALVRLEETGSLR